MRIVSSYRPGQIKDGVKRTSVNSNAVFVFSLYVSGLITGCILYVSSEQVRNVSGHLLSETLVNAMPLSGLILLFSVFVLGIGTVLFGSGLSLVGYPCIYLTPFGIGLITGAFFLSYSGTGLPMGAVKSLLLLPVYGAVICAVLMMSEYSAEMSGSLVRGAGGREAAETKKYALRIILLMLSAIICGCILALTVVLERHIS